MRTIADLVEHARLAQDIDTATHDIGADLLAQGCTLSEIARVMERSRQTITDRFVVTPEPRELQRASARVELYHGCRFHGVRVAALDRFVVFYDSEGWRVLRHCQDATAATALAEWLGEQDGFRFNRRPRDLSEPMPWHFPLGRNKERTTGR